MALREQDRLIELILQQLNETDPETGTKTSVVEVIRRFELAIGALFSEGTEEGRKWAQTLKISPNTVPAQVPLPLSEALVDYDHRTSLCQRVFVGPTFREIRHVLNTAVVRAVHHRLELLTLDADETIYEDGGVLRGDSPILGLIARLLNADVRVALVTAAGYTNPQRYEARLEGLLTAFQLALELGAPRSMLDRFLVMGGESSYLLKCTVRAGQVRLQHVEPARWKDGRGVRWDHGRVQQLLDAAEECLRQTAQRLRLEVKIIRKERAVGMVRDDSAAKFPYEVLEEVALSAQAALKDFEVPFCAFNGGADVWVDVGNKALGIKALQAFVHASPETSLHIGDRFSRTGNDYKAREVANTLWIANPLETEFYLRFLLQHRIADVTGQRGVPVGAALSRGRSLTEEVELRPPVEGPMAWSQRESQEGQLVDSIHARTETAFSPISGLDRVDVEEDDDADEDDETREAGGEGERQTRRRVIWGVADEERLDSTFHRMEGL